MKTKIQKIIIAAAVLFAAGLSNISAIAQESDGVMTPARANVYTQATGMYSTSSQFDYDLSETLINLTDTAMNADQSGVGNRIHLDFRRIDSDGTMIVPNPVPESGLPTFGTSAELIKAGDLFLIFNPLTGIFPNAVSSGPWRVYRRASDMALVLATVNANPAETAGTGEFFLDANFTETTEVVHGSQGLIDAVCDTANGYELNPNDSTSCVIPANCGDNATRNSDDITMCVCENTETHQFVDGSTTTCELIPDGNTETENPQDGNTDTPEPGTDTPQTQNPTRRTSGGDSESKAARVIGIVGIGMAMYAIANGGLVSDSFAFSPDFGYDITESGYAINGGGKISYSEGDLQMYWTAKQTNANGKFGDFRYTSGGKYTADIWTATFSESVAGETAKYSFGLSADMDGYFIGISPVYRLHSFYDKDKSETRNELNLQGDFRYNNWQIRPAAGFRWENEKDFADNARFSIDAVRRF